MSVFRIKKTKDYTVMSNYHFKEKEISLKAKGLLSLMLSLPDDWDYSIAGLSKLCKDNETSIKSALNELKQFGYLEVIKKMPNETDSGRIEYEYIIYEHKQEKQDSEKQALEILPLEILPLENRRQLNTKELSTKESKIKHKYGEYLHVLLTDEEVEKLKKLYPGYLYPCWEDYIKFLDEYIEMKGYKAKSHYLCIKRWVVDAVKEKISKNKNLKQNNSYQSRKYSEQDLDKLFDNVDEVNL